MRLSWPSKIRARLGRRGRASMAPVPNLLVHSDALVLWTGAGVTVTPYVGYDPLGAPVTEVNEFANTSQHSLTAPSTVAFVAGQKYVFSVRAAKGLGKYIQLLLGSGAFGVNGWANFDLDNGVVGSVGGAGVASITSIGDGFYLCSLVITATGTASSGAVVFLANAATMTRALGYTGDATKSVFLSGMSIVKASKPTRYNSTESKLSFTGNITNVKVGAIRWDAWTHPTEDTIRGAVETSLGPTRYHWRLPFFATEPTTTSAQIAGAQADMDTEISYAVEAGLDYWAFFWYGGASTNGMNNGFALYQSSDYRNDINWCYFFSGITPFGSDMNNATYLADIVAKAQQGNYQKTLDGRPLFFIYDDSGSRANLAADLIKLRTALTAVGLSNPYVAFTQSTPDASVIDTYGFDATTMYTPVNSVTGAKPYSDLDTAARAKWDTQKAQDCDVIPCFSMGWDRRPRVDNPVPWEGASGSISDYYYLANSSAISTHLDAILAWVRANRTAARANVVLGYAWNENDEGGWITPTIGRKGGVNKSHMDAVKAVLSIRGNGEAAILPPRAGAPTPPVVRSFTNTNYTSETNTTLAAPTGLADGDILLAFLFVGSGSGVDVTPPAGFTALTGSPVEVVDGGGFTGRSSVFWKRASAEAGSYTFTHNAASSQGILFAISGALASDDPIDASSHNSGTGSAESALSITTTVDNDLVFWLAHDWEGNGGLTPPTGFTEVLDTLMYAAYKTQAAAGATGVVSMTGGSAPNEPWTAWLVAIKPIV